MKSITIAPYMPLKLLEKNKLLEENDNYEFIDEIDYNKLYFGSKKTLIEEINKEALLPRNELFIKLIDISKAEKNFRTRQLERIKLEDTQKIVNNIGKYAILSYVWGKRENSADILSKGGVKALAKAIEACKSLDIKYLWMDQLCVNQEDREEVSKQISELGQYYNNASVTLVAIQTKFSKNNCCNGESERIADKESALRKIVNSEWFSRPWTYQEGWLSKRTVFMFDNILVDGRTMAQFWVFYQPLCTKYGKCGSLEELTDGSVKIATPVGWVYYNGGYTSEDKVFLNLSEALREVKKRGKNRLVEGIYSILGLLPYGSKVKVKCKERGCVYTEEELQEALFDVLWVAKQEGFDEDFEQLDLGQVLEETKEKVNKIYQLRNKQISNFSQQEAVIQQDLPHLFTRHLSK